MLRGLAGFAAVQRGEALPHRIDDWENRRSG